MTLAVQNAQIRTATVEVRTLTISRKQVTLAVFRQLQERPWLNGDGEPNGPAWGTVNYHPDKCADDARHEHVVWQDGSDLRRSRVVQPRFTDNVSCPYTLMDGWLAAAVLEGWRPNPDAVRFSVRFRTGVLPFYAPDHVQTVFKGPPEANLLWREEALKRYDTAVARLEADADGRSAAEWEQEVCREMDAEAARRNRLAERWREVEALPQLFIAV